VKGYRDIRGDGGSNILGQVAAQQARLAARMAPIRATVAVVSGKGGVGKSSITANLAAALAGRGLAIGVLDADLNGPSMAKMLGVRGQALRVEADGVRPALSADGIRVLSMDLLLPTDETPVVWDAPTQAEAHTWRGTMEGTALREFLADTAWGTLDLLLVDLPPGADRLPTLLDLLPGLTGAVVVTIPSAVSHLVVRRAMTLAAERGARLLGLVENMAGYVCPTCGTLGPLYEGPGGEATAARHGLPFLGRVPFDPRLATAADRGRPFVLDYGDTPTGWVLARIAGALAAAVLPG
jgi:ATP-binding protein involved in chromosome partitioning